MADSQRGSLCTRSEISHLESVESDKEGSSSALVHLMSLTSTKIQNLPEPLDAGRAGLKPMQPMRLHWAPRHGVWAGCFCQIPLAHENCRKPYKSHCQPIIIV